MRIPDTEPIIYQKLVYLLDKPVYMVRAISYSLRDQSDESNPCLSFITYLSVDKKCVFLYKYRCGTVEVALRITLNNGLLLIKHIQVTKRTNGNFIETKIVKPINYQQWQKCSVTVPKTRWSYTLSTEVNQFTFVHMVG